MIRRRSSNFFAKNNRRTKRATLSRARGRRSKGSGKALRESDRPTKEIRYAVVGLGHIAQTAVLPAFAHAKTNSKLAALVSQDRVKLKELQKKYKVPLTASYDDFDDLLRSGEIDAVFIAEPNSLHCEFAVRSAQAGVHVLCEKPLAVTEEECRRMIRTERENGVKLMTAYRLHFERANLEAIEVVQSGKLGEPRFFSSVFSMQAKQGNIRLQAKLGGGTLYDLGVYCINAARYLFREEPIEVVALTANNGERRFREVDEMTGGILRFPGERLATFISSFGAADSDAYDIVGTKGSLHVKNAYEYAMPVEWELSVGDKKQKRTFAQRDQFAPELVYFSDCILNDKEPEPSGVEGLNDVRIIRALYESAAKGGPVQVKNDRKNQWPHRGQQIKRPRVKEPEQIRAENPSRS